MADATPVAGQGPPEPSRETAPDRYYFESLKAGKFLIQLCGDCRKHVFYPRLVCPHCGSLSLDWVAPSGLGTVYSTTTMARRPEKGGDYNLAIIRLDEGVQMMSRVEKVKSADVAIGMRVRALLRTDGEAPIVVFEPAGEA